MKYFLTLSFSLIFIIQYNSFGSHYTYKDFKKLDSLITIHKYTDRDKSIKYAIDMLHVAKALQNDEHIGYAFHRVGYIYSIMGDYGQAVFNYLNAIDYKKKYSDNEGIGECYAGLGGSFFKANEYKKAIYYLQKSVKYLNGYPKNPYLHDAFFYFAEIYRNKKEYKTALKYQLISRDLTLKSNDLPQLALENTHLASIFRKINLYDSALRYDNIALTIGKLINDTIIIARALNNIGFNYHCNGDYSKAITYFKSSIKLRGKAELGNTYLSLADSYIKSGNAHEANVALKQAMLNYPPNLQDVANTIRELAMLYKKQKDFEASTKYYELLHNTEESIIHQSKTDYHITYASKYARSGEERYFSEREKDFFSVVNKMQRDELIVIVILLGVILIFTIILLKKYLINFKIQKKFSSDFKLANNTFKEIINRYQN